MLEKTTKINMLYDFYHSLLTNKQKEYMEMYYREDYSLGEIAELSEVSRQAVYDNIKRTEQLLVSYEEKLALYEKFLIRKKLFDQLKKTLSKEDNNEANQLMEALEKID